VALNKDQQLIREIVDALQLRQQRLAYICGISFAAIHAWLNGMRSPTKESFARLAVGLDEYAKTVRKMADLAAERAAEAR
jgi:transcriptional regulator with XRE-family HTH domain